MRKLIGIAMALVLTICLFAGCGGKNAQPEATPSPTPAPTAEPTPTPAPTPMPFDAVVQNRPVGFAAAENDAAVYNALSEAWTAEKQYLSYGGETIADPEIPEDVFTFYGTAAASREAAGSPVTDGTYIYMLSGTTLHILNADGANSAPLASVEVGSGWSDTQEGHETTWGGFEKYPSRLYINSGKLVILSDWYGYESYMQDNVNVCDYTEYTCVDIYDLSNPLAPVLAASFGQDGVCCGVQISDGVLYLVTDHPVYSDADASDTADYLPGLYSAEGAQTMTPEQIVLPEEPADSRYAVVAAYDLTAAVRLDAKALLGINGEAVMAAPRIYLFSARHSTALSASYRDNIYDVSEYAAAASTDVYAMELSGGVLEVKNAGSVMGHPAGEQAAALLDESLYIALREENFRYTLYKDAQHGFENVLWGELESENATAVMSSQLQAVDGVTAEAFNGYLYNWSVGCFVGFSREEAGALKLTMQTKAADGTLQETSAKTFGSDYSETLSSADSIYVNGEKNVIGFPADDGYSFYRWDTENGFSALFDAYITDWPWHVRCVAVGDFLYMTDRTTVYIYSLADMTLVHTLTL